MIQALWISKTGLSAQDTRLSTISNNLANAATVGYKRDSVVFEDLLYQIRRQPGAQSSESTQLPSGVQIGTGVRVIGTTKEFTSGSVEITEQPLDLAIVGRGFFEVLLPDGSQAYTRNGQFQVNATGEIVNARGYPLQPGITIPDNAQSITISSDGIVEATVFGQAGAQGLGTLTVTNFINPAGLQAIGTNLFLETTASGAPIAGTPGEDGIGSIEQGSLENSNVDTVEELVNMITTQRTYEMNSKVISTADQMLQFVSQNL
ncbi:flagellar basal-body rod protein FlgG [Dasania sp. GY-MA-18]|uniref:Flagellar basal-body rod protein FlgG n=1 Tax=Dasania phycosphaerae TaxID=2950436 RepID=A0A9J6RHS9_9GAMM|nr:MULTISPECIES: flagellar basal-body rod protein FlgG [Dasania]MCR8921396.1 flagellar basal-body rod protein FlgG [Dasania sp. GY-MA-18]MCZ0863824.1 flagellar basal-body rod protein FlgG [Dasania phycosphaerae]MCZ0867552.1 flagellar basal-body rod protein FlgG [Dasania phycosphaerae]